LIFVGADSCTWRGAVRCAHRSLTGAGAWQVKASSFTCAARGGALIFVGADRCTWRGAARFDVRIDPLLVLEIGE
jgi:hypothetical protein